MRATRLGIEVPNPMPARQSSRIGGPALSATSESEDDSQARAAAVWRSCGLRRQYAQKLHGFEFVAGLYSSCQSYQLSS
jgi:hypothetical protein